MTEVLVVQHAEKERQPRDPGLTALGREQASATAAWIAAHVVADEVWSSPQRRAVETCDPIAAGTGLEPSTDPRLRERMNWEGEEVQSLDDFLSDWQGPAGIARSCLVQATRRLSPATGSSPRLMTSHSIDRTGR